MHSENNSPFLTITSMIASLRVSHWGNIAVERGEWTSSTRACSRAFLALRLPEAAGQRVSSVRSFQGVGWWARTLVDTVTV